jgi:NAD+ synthase (glutamine-hydrolysing)
MRLVKIGIANLRSTVGAVRSNSEAVIAAARAMAADSVTIACFPEQVIGGYPPEDLVQWPAFLSEQRLALERIAAQTRGLPTVLVLGLAVGVDGRIFNTAAVVHGGRVVGLVPKEKLPTYQVFYEARTFSRGCAGLALDAADVPLGDYIFEFDFGTLAAEVCEDSWSPDGPMRRRGFARAEIVVNLSASPFRTGITATRREMLATRSADNQITLIYVNAVGAQDGLVFDGGGYVFQNGRPLLEAPRFREARATCVIDLDRTTRLRREHSTWRSDCEAFCGEHVHVPALRSLVPTGHPAGLGYPLPPNGNPFLPPSTLATRSPRDEMLDDLYEALALGVHDYMVKTGSLRRLAVPLSGGRDSVLTLLVAWHAARTSPEAGLVHAVYLPSRHSRSATRAAAETICRELQIPLHFSSIDEAYGRELAAVRALVGSDRVGPMTEQNIQARVRALRIWSWCNATESLFLQCGDMSEKAVGYTTIGGDLEGGLSVIANVPKTVVSALLERLSARFGFEGITRCLAAEPSPELAPEQLAEAELMPFPVLDTCLYLYAGEKLSPAELAQVLPAAFPDLPAEKLREYAEQFVTAFTRSIYKWVQAPLSLHVGTLDLERERALQLPVVQRSEWGWQTLAPPAQPGATVPASSLAQSDAIASGAPAPWPGNGAAEERSGS